jgi:site-specific DNA-adenine methylase
MGLDNLRRQLGDAIWATRLAEAREQRLAQRGVLFMLSNSDCELTRELFSAYRIDTLSVRRRVGGHAERRGVAQEIVVRNYEGSRNALPLAGCTGSSP